MPTSIKKLIRPKFERWNRASAWPSKFIKQNTDRRERILKRQAITCQMPEWLARSLPVTGDISRVVLCDMQHFQAPRTNPLISTI